MKYLALALLLVCAVGRSEVPYPPDSIYNLDVPLVDQDGTRQRLDLHAGHPVLITMFYGSCPMACPMLIDTLRLVDQSMSSAQRQQVRIVMISIDPERDTVAALRSLAATRHLDTARWTLLRTDAASVRKIAAVLNIQYRQLPDGSFNHSSVISLLTPQGELARQSSVLTRVDPALLQALTGQLGPTTSRH